MRTRVIPAVILAALVALAWPALAGQPEARNLVAHLDGDEEVPARNTLAQGQAVFHLSKDGAGLRAAVKQGFEQCSHGLEREQAIGAALGREHDVLTTDYRGG